MEPLGRPIGGAVPRLELTRLRLARRGQAGQRGRASAPVPPTNPRLVSPAISPPYVRGPPQAVSDGVEIAHLRAPAKLAVRLARIADQFGRIARAARADAVRDRPARGPRNRIEHFADALPAPRAEVEGVGTGRGVEPVEGTDMGVGEVTDVDIIADTGAVGGRVIVAEQRQWRAVAGDRLHRQRDEV